MNSIRKYKTRHPTQSPPASERRLEARLVPVLAFLFSLLYILTGFRGWLVFSIGFWGVWLMAFVWVASLQRGLRVERKIHYAWAHVGDSVPEEIIISNKSRFPAIWVEMLDESDSLADPLRLVTDVEARASRRRHPIHQFKRRGLFKLGPTRLKTGDPFGVYSLTLHDFQASNILVTPPQLALSQIHISAGGWAGDRQRAVQHIEREIRDAGIREYIPGDSMRRIHWHASAHFDSLIVRKLDSATSADWWIYLDLDKSTQAGSGQDSTMELSIVLAASLVSRGLREHRRVGLALAGPSLVLQEPHSGSAHKWKLMRTLSIVEPGEHTIKQLLSTAGSMPTASLIIITASCDADWIAAIDKRHQHSGRMVLLVDPSEFNPGKDQRNVTKTLARRGIPHIKIPRILLEEAYRGPSRDGHKRLGDTEASQRYLGREKSTWQRLD